MLDTADAGASTLSTRNDSLSQAPVENRIRLLLLDDHVLFRASLARYLASEKDLEIGGECTTFAQALDLLGASAIDLVLLDFELGPHHASDFISAARQAGYPGRFLLVAGAADARAAAVALKLGASGIFLKSESPERLVHAIRLVAAGEVWVDPKVIQMLAEQLVDRYEPLGDQGLAGIQEDRERSVLLGILGGLTNKKIGVNMGLSESSVKNIVQRLFGKAGVKTRSQLVRAALEGSLGTPKHLSTRNVN
jgi:DNA-binding NarL/FixJ family response regulator